MRSLPLIICLTIGLLLTIKAYSQIAAQPQSLRSPFATATDLKDPRVSEKAFNYGLNSNNPFIADEYIEVVSYNSYGLPKFFSDSTPAKLTGTWEEKAQAWLGKQKSLMQVDGKTSFVTSNISTDDLGTTHIKMDQYHDGIKVFDGEIILHAQDGQITMQNGNYVPTAELYDVSAKRISTQVAKQAIVADLKNFKEDWNPLSMQGIGKDRQQWEGKLVFYNNEGVYVTAYNYVVFANLAERFEYLVDATTGEILNHWPLTCNLHGNIHAHSLDADGTCNHEESSTLVAGPAQANAVDLLGANRVINTYEENGTYFMIDASRSMYRDNVSEIPDEPVGAIWTIDIGGQSPINSNATFAQIASGNNSWGNSTAGVSAHYNAGEAFEYFEDVHGRSGITGDGQTIVSIVNVTNEDGSSMGNAFYNSLAIWYGNGDNTFLPLGRGLDVAGHELSHGVVENSANLIYQNEPGAMNESFADIFGAMIDRDDWKIGEDVVRAGVFPGGALRAMDDPHNGASTQDFGNGWQPRHMNERFTGSEDNGGVHINSGIPNYAYYRFAQQVGKETAERVFYRALTTYLTRSSGFNDLRYAVEQSASDLYDQSVVDRAGQAFTDVGIGTSTVPDYETEIDVNSGSDLLLHSDLDKNNLYVANLNDGTLIFNPLSTTAQFSRPSITDDGSQIIFVGQDNFVYLINIDWNSNPPRSEEIRLDQLFGGGWYNAVISKDGNRVALIEDADVNEIVVYDDIIGQSRTYELYNPSFTNGVETGDVRFADSMEFDYTGNTLMYDALNIVESGTSNNNIEYWDIGFLEIWNPSAKTFGSGDIDKLFGSLPDNISLGNPTFSKNSPHIIAFDVREELSTDDYEFSVIGMNIETNTRKQILGNNTFSYPNYSRDDQIMVFDYSDGTGAPSFPDVAGIGRIGIDDDKISGISGTDAVVQAGRSWGTWFTNGVRVLPTSTAEVGLEASRLILYPNPAKDFLDIKLESGDDKVQLVELEVYDSNGRRLLLDKTSITALSPYRLNTAAMRSGFYILSLRMEKGLISRKFVKE